MLLNHPKRLLVTAILLMVFGVLMPLLMVIKVVESTFFLNFLSYGSTTLGFLLGIISVAASQLKQKKRDDDKNKYK